MSMKENEPLCLALGMGAIGKAVSGYAMTRAGVHVVFADIDNAQIQTVNRDGGYWLGTADIYSKQVTKEFITGVEALHAESPGAQKAAVRATYLITAVGPRGFHALLPRVIGWLKARAAVSDAPLYYMVFENDSGAMVQLHEAVDEAFGTCPSWLHLAKCSIERMTKVVNLPDVGTIALGETYIPIIADQTAMTGCGIYDRTDLIEMVDDAQRYYYRKLLTTNLGHAVLSYFGYPKGYRNTLEAMADPEIYELLRETLSESGKTVCKKWGFPEKHIEQLLDTLMLRLANPGLVDDLERLSRDPIRKISPDERIILPIRLCYQYGIEPSGLLKTLHRAIWYTNPNVEGGQELIDLRQSIGEEEILKTVCKAEGQLLKDALRVAKQ